MTALDLTSSSLEERAGVLLARQYDGIWRRTDRLLAGLLVFQYVAGIVAALVVSPRDWEGEESSLHLHVWAAVILAASLPLCLCISRSSIPVALSRDMSLRLDRCCPEHC